MVEPVALLLDITRRCNANCRICGRRYWTEKPPPDMPLDLALRLIDLPYIERVKLGGYGEPFLWPHLVAATKRASEQEKYVWTTTNGQLATESKMRALLDAGICKIIFSIDSIRESTYAKLRTNLDLPTVLGNLETAARLRGSSYPARLVVNYVRSVENVTESDESVRAFLEDHGADGVCITPEVDVSPLKGTRGGEPIVCERPYIHLTVRADGQLQICCRDGHGDVEGLGSVVDQDPLVLYNAEPFCAIRKALETGEGYPALCQGCRVHFDDRRPPKRAP